MCGSGWSIEGPESEVNLIPYSNSDIEDTMNEEQQNAGVLLQTLTALRIHWSTVITNHFGYIITASSLIWAYFLHSYFTDQFVRGDPLLILVPGAITAILIGVWRCYTHYIDNEIVELYPEIVRCELLLSVPPDQGIIGYLCKHVPSLTRELAAENDVADKIDSIKQAIKHKKIGYRGHLRFDILSLVVILSFIVIGCLKGLSGIDDLVLGLCAIGFATGIFFVILGIYIGQKDVKEVITSKFWQFISNITHFLH
jgi:hypothetical protein